MADLQRKVVAFLDGRRTAELADLIQRHTGIPLAAPCLRERHRPDPPSLQAGGALDQDAVDALLITSQAQVDNLFGVATDHGRWPKLANVAIGVQGPVAEAALERHGLHAAFRPAHGHMGALVLGAADYLSSVPQR